MQDVSLIRIVVLVNIVMLGPAVWELERDWLAPIVPLEVVILSAIVLAALVTIDHLRWI
ncbi:hypothetical protein [Methanosphaerula palustris]|uniref:Uncharacterized protein n=1 Tax=Methanosphaerula palustris (strain ATCC BAA-1556 / DSM 19958 / E1-9c) TaxID=521011 RepID=B8GDJ3_METPE|nr:hypothetical protein [Methanosphaerula palustris]ACL17344.1 hypothetical protein Mpal_2045 [Methanosphaerula palustris E1-9c]